MIWTSDSIADVLRSAAHTIGTFADDEQERKVARGTLEAVGLAFGLEVVLPLPRKQGQETELRDLMWVEPER